MKFLSFDLETLRLIPEDSVDNDWRANSLGISCAAAAFSDQKNVKFWRAVKGLDKTYAQKVIHYLEKKVQDGYTIVTWNGTNFDFAVLAYESGLYDQCAELAMNHVDLMMIVTFTKGWRLSLQSACKGSNLPGKVKNVELSDGTLCDDMSGEKAIDLWTQGEFDAVLTYLEGDVRQTLALVEKVQKNKIMRWTSQSGSSQYITVSKMLLAKDCFNIEEPDTEWMDNPLMRISFIDWMPDEVIERYILPF